MHALLLPSPNKMKKSLTPMKEKALINNKTLVHHTVKTMKEVFKFYLGLNASPSVRKSGCAAFVWARIKSETAGKTKIANRVKVMSTQL